MTPTLPYESGVAGALRPGERVLWEDHPHPPPAKRHVAQRIAALVTLPMAALILGIVGAAAVDVIATLTVLVAVLVVAAIVASDRADAKKRRELDHVRYRVTTRRVIRADDRAARRGDGKQADLFLAGGIMVRHGPRPAIAVGLVQFDDVPDPAPVLRLLLDQCSRSGRRIKVRRTPDGAMQMGRRQMAIGNANATAPGMPPPPPPPISICHSPLAIAHPVPAEITLAADERILWVGRPRVRDPRDRDWWVGRSVTLAWQVVPAALLLSACGLLPAWAPRAHWMVGVFAAVWLFIAGRALLIEPVLERRRRDRTWYVLTNVRAITHQSGKGGHTRSLLLDMVDNVGVRDMPGGVANLWIGSATFERIADAAAVHALALEAVRVAGTPWGGIVPPERIAESAGAGFDDDAYDDREEPEGRP